MKSILKIKLFIGLFALSLTSCYNATGEHYDDFAQEYTIGGAGKYVWKYDSPGIYYCDIFIGELTQRIYDKRMITTYYVHEVNKRLVDSPLPFDEFFMDDKGYQWTYQYHCEYSPGLVTIVFKDSSFAENNPPSCTFVVKMMR